VCCDLPESVLVPPPVAAMLAEYRRLQATSILDWGHEVPELPGAEYGRFLELSRLWPLVAETGDWSEAIRRSVPDPLPRGMILAKVGPTGIALSTGPLTLLPPGMSTEVGVLLDSGMDAECSIVVGGEARRVRAGAIVLATATVSHDEVTVAVGDATVVAGEAVAGSRLRLRAGGVSRWSVLDDRGQAWFAEGRLHKWDDHGRPFFHGNDVVLDVPARPLTIWCTRGMEFVPVSATVTPGADDEELVELEPARAYDAAARGWYGGDLHVHMNYSGDLVCGPHDAALMQRGEGLHLMNLVAGNLLGARIYDREAFEHFAGEDLPWSTDDQLGRWSVEFRNDLLGHFHAFAPTTPPVRYQTGHTGAAHAEDWPPNATACRDLRDRGATIGYTHPVLSSLSDGTPADAFVSPRSTEARELVADAALGLVDSVDLLGPNDPEGTAVLYHHLLSCGLRLTATVGTDVFLSHSRSGSFSNPPGWGRVYADLGGERLSTESWQRAIRAGRTFATNGPWLELGVSGSGPGSVLELQRGDVLPVRVRAEGPGVETVEVIGADGTLATAEGQELETELVVAEPGWVAAIARGPGHPAVLGPTVFAHTSPVYLDVGGLRVGRPRSAAWCLDWLERVEQLASEHGTFADESQWRDLVEVLDEARRFYRDVAVPA
jgi:hypothetical protein